MEQDVLTSAFLKAYERAKCHVLQEDQAEEGELLSKPRTLCDKDNQNTAGGENFKSEDKQDDNKISKLLAREEAIKNIVDDWSEFC